MKPTTGLQKPWKSCRSTGNHLHHCQSGIVYIARVDGEKDLFKVGRTRDLQTLLKREKQIEVEYQLTFTVTCFYHTDTCVVTLEKFFHDRLKTLKVNSYGKNNKRNEELFRIDSMDVLYLLYSLEEFMELPVARFYRTDAGIDLDRLAQYELGSN